MRGTSLQKAAKLMRLRDAKRGFPNTCVERPHSASNQQCGRGGLSTAMSSIMQARRVDPIDGADIGGIRVGATGPHSAVDAEVDGRLSDGAGIRKHGRTAASVVWAAVVHGRGEQKVERHRGATGTSGTLEGLRLISDRLAGCELVVAFPRGSRGLRREQNVLVGDAGRKH